MKMLILGDLHYDIKSNDYLIDINLNKVLDNYVMPYIKKNNIKYLVQLGDVFENKRGVSSFSGYNYIKHFLKPVIENDLILYQILGNHDIFYDSVNKIDSLDMFFSLLDNKNLHLIKDNKRVVINNKELIFCSYNNTMDLKEVYGDVLFCHFDIDGFEMQNGYPVRNGIKQSEFSNFNKIISGHIHKRDTQKNITYVGSLIENNFGECDYSHGFHVLDLETLDLEFIPIDNKVFISIDRNDIDKYDLKDKVVEIKFKEDDSNIEIEKCLEGVRSFNPANVKAKYETKKIVDDVKIESYELFDVLKEYIDIEYDKINKDFLYSLILKIHDKIL